MLTHGNSLQGACSPWSVPLPGRGQTISGSCDAAGHIAAGCRSAASPRKASVVESLSTRRGRTVDLSRDRIKRWDVL